MSSPTLARRLQTAGQQTGILLTQHEAQLLADIVTRSYTREATENAAYLDIRPRLSETLHALACGENAPQTAARLGLSVDTVKTRRKDLYRRLGAESGAQAVAIGSRMGLIPLLAGPPQTGGRS
jgi:DNA-binding NarL/FixJ family response regulator